MFFPIFFNAQASAKKKREVPRGYVTPKASLPATAFSLRNELRSRQYFSSRKRRGNDSPHPPLSRVAAMGCGVRDPHALKYHLERKSV